MSNLEFTEHYHGTVITPVERKVQEPAQAGPQERRPLEPFSYVVLPACCITVLAGKIIEMRPVKGCMEPEATITLKLDDDQFFLPGFIDTHTHAPQFPNLGIGQDYQLLEWLKEITYPMEAKFCDDQFARDVYPSVVRRIVDFGTTTCCYYGSIHLNATKILVHEVNEIGQRAFIGKCNMDREVPVEVLEETNESIQETQSLVDHINDLNSPLIRPIITPRFAISCTPDLLRGLAKLAKDSDLHIQTHISENLDDIARMGELFPSHKSYADVYDWFGLLGPKTILAHAVHLGEDEMDLIKEKEAGISHCPTSNFNLTSGVAPVGEFLDKGIKVGLGTDVSGGFSPSILKAIQNASIASKVIALQHNPSGALKPGYNNRKLSVATLLYLATLGGAHVCGLEKDIGSLAPGKCFDALVVKGISDSGPYLHHDEYDDKYYRRILERFLFSGDDRNILRVYVQGNQIKGPRQL